MTTDILLFDDIDFDDIIENIVNTAVSVADAETDAAYSYAVDEEFLACEKDLADIFRC